MKVEQAIYGEVRGGHALRAASDHSGVSAQLTSHLDLPDTAPPGVNWSPFLSGFPHGDRYVLSRTFADPAAARAGMVLSHAVIAPLVEVTTTADLRPLLAPLIMVTEVPEALESLEIPASTDLPPPAIDLEATAEALTTRGTGPVVRIGTQGFEDLVVALWFRLWPELRAGFAFRLSFGPHDLVDKHKPSLVCTPTALAARWTGHRIIGSAGPVVTTSAAGILSGGVEAEPVLRFAREIGAPLDNLIDLPLLERAYKFGSALHPSFEECVAVLRLVDRLSSDPTAGAAGKVRLIERLNSRLATAAVREVLLLRNLSTVGLPAANALWASLESWAATNAFVQADDLALLSAIDDALSSAAAVEAWRGAIVAGIASASRSKSSAFPAAFWRWAEIRATTLVALAGHLPEDCDLENRLSEAAPIKVGRDIGDAVMKLALSKHWRRLHGAAAGATLTPREAIRRQLSIDAELASLDGIKAALRRATAEQVLAIALEVAEPRIQRIAAEEVARKPQLLKDVDFSGAPAQEVWARALSINSEAWRGPADPPRSFAVVIQKLLDGGSASAELIAALSTTPIADLSDYSRRTEVWQRVADPARINLLRATAAGWLERASSGQVSYALDPLLESTLLTGDRLDRKLRVLASITAGVRIISALPNCGETRFLGWLEELAAARRLFTLADAEALGRLVLDRHWRRAVDHLVRIARMGRADVKPAIRICQGMIDIFTRWSLGLAPVSYEEKWTVLEDLAVDLYPSGPDHDELWERAGGRNADLQSFGNGRVRWRAAIAQVRRGKGPRPSGLIREMKSDFPFNDQVRYLASDSDFGGDSK